MRVSRENWGQVLPFAFSRRAAGQSGTVHISSPGTTMQIWLTPMLVPRSSRTFLLRPGAMPSRYAWVPGQSSHRFAVLLHSKAGVRLLRCAVPASLEGRPGHLWSGVRRCRGSPCLARSASQRPTGPLAQLGIAHGEPVRGCAAHPCLPAHRLRLSPIRAAERVESCSRVDAFSGDCR